MTVIRSERGAIMSGIVEFRDMIFFGGVISEDPTPDIGVQMKSICAQLDELLEKAKSSRRHLLSAQIFLTDMANKPKMSDVWLEWLGGDLPTRATIGVSDLGEGVLVEVVVVAAKC